MLQHELARVIAVHRDSYLINKGGTDVFAEPIGKLIYGADSPLDLPTTGDWVYADFYEEDSHAIVHEVLPRKTLLKRKTSGKAIEFQLIAANVDCAFILQSLDHDFSLRRMERYLVMANENKIAPIVLLSKCDLLAEQEVSERVESIETLMPDVMVIPFSNQTGFNIDKIEQRLVLGQTYCLLGSSGVGKTSLLNSIAGEEKLATKSVREKDSKGMHTTTHRELIQLNSGAMIIDTPGMRELGNMAMDAGIDETFTEITELARLCKFSDCSHVNEKGCAILDAIGTGALSAQRFQNYLSMKKESRFNEMSYLEKKQKDKQFGKLIKSALNHKAKK